MRLAILLLLSFLPAFGADASVTLTLDDAYVESFRSYLAANHIAADTNGNGAVTSAEALAWIQLKAQETLNTFARRAVEWAEVEDPTTLPAAHQSAVTAKQAAEAALETERAKITP